jgi:hypothetical protein
MRRLLAYQRQIHKVRHVLIKADIDAAAERPQIAVEIDREAEVRAFIDRRTVRAKMIVIMCDIDKFGIAAANLSRAAA